jgi:hypothetical protein
MQELEQIKEKINPRKIAIFKAFLGWHFKKAFNLSLPRAIYNALR